jgi:hypothetical protein
VALKIDELFDRLALTGFARSEGRGGTVVLCLTAIVVEAGVAFAGTLRGQRIDRLEVGDHFLNRAVQTVEAEPVEPRLRPLAPADAVVVVAQPTKCHITSLRHIHVGNRSKPRSASSAVLSSLRPRT